MDVTNVKIPYTDLKVNITRYITNKWQEIWDTFPDNKLYAIQPEVTNTSITLDKRRDDIVITRARIGHTYLTQVYLLKGEQIPECVPCSDIVTVRHILIECIDYLHVRQKHYDVPNLQTLFKDVHPSKILEYLKEIDLYRQF